MGTFTGHSGVEDVCFKNNEIFITGGRDRELTIWDYRTGVSVARVKNMHHDDINCISVRDNIILSGGEDGKVNIIDDRMYQSLYSFSGERPVRSIGFNPHSKIFAVGNDLLSIYSFD